LLKGGTSQLVSEPYEYNTSLMAIFLKTYSEDTLRCPYKYYSSLNRWQANWDLLSAFTFCNNYRSGYMTLPPVPLQEQPTVVVLLEGVVVSWSLAMDERGEHKDLRGLGRRSVITYVHERTELYCSILPCLSLPFCLPTSVKRHLPEPFIAQGRVVTLRPGARQVALRWLKPYTTSMVLWLGVANDVLHGASSVESSCLIALLH
jgi:hypothetical protein